MSIYRGTRKLIYFYNETHITIVDASDYHDSAKIMAHRYQEKSQKEHQLL